MPAMTFALLMPDSVDGRRLAVRDRVADFLAIMLALAYGSLILPLGAAMSPGALLPWPVDVLIGLACTGTLVLRRRWPLGVAMAVVPFGAVSVMATGAIYAALFSLAVRRRASVALGVAAVNVALGAAYFLLHADPPFPAWVDPVLRAVISAAAVGWGLFVDAHRRLTRSLREHAERLEVEQHNRVEQARLTERARIAREMHDVLAHRLSLVSLYAGALGVRGELPPEELTVAVDAIRSSAHTALQELRTVIGVLRDDPPGRPELPQPGFGDIPGLVEGVTAHGMLVDYRSDVPEEAPPAILGRTAYRIVQEALTNAGKHAHGSPVKLRISGQPGSELGIRMSNPDRGQPLMVPGAGLGLVGVEERVALAGGRVEYGKAQGVFRLEVWLPWPA
ncbi:histidine kinase [Nonomuraea sp. NPDC050691]|uniref:sensor histidine kinase n=1 Tax=Nonomuraea sp. NPDC050691 TaxID=3155661 RepID=UPI0033C4E22B